MEKNLIFVPVYRDVMFKYLFGTERNKRFLVDFLESFYNLKPNSLKNLNIINSVVLDKENVLQRKYELDVKIELNDGKLINLEMQNTYNLKAEKRLFTYLTGLFYTKLKRSNDVNKLRKVTAITLTRNLTIHKNNKTIQKFHMTNDNYFKDKLLSDLFETVLVDIEHFCEYSRNRNSRFINWLKFIRAKSLKELKKIATLDPILMDAYKECVKFMSTEYVQDLELQEKFRRMEELEEKEERERKLKIAKKRALRQGLQQGLEQGKNKKMYEIAINFLKTDSPLETISSCTGVSLEELKNLKKKIISNEKVA